MVMPLMVVVQSACARACRCSDSEARSSTEESADDCAAGGTDSNPLCRLVVMMVRQHRLRGTEEQGRGKHGGTDKLFHFDSNLLL